MPVTKQVFLSLCIAVTAFATSAAAADPKPSKPPIQMVTIADIGRPYTVIDGACTAELYPPITFADGFAQTLSKASNAMQQVARQNGADAVVGMIVSWETPNSIGAKGRVLICGTLVKFK